MKSLNQIVAERIAERSLIDPLGGARELAKEFTGPDHDWLAPAEAERAVNDRPEQRLALGDSEIARLTRQRKLRDISKVVFDAAGIESELRSMVMTDAASIPRVLYGLCSLTEELDFDEALHHATAHAVCPEDDDWQMPIDLDQNIRELAEVLAALHKRYPELVRLGMQGRLASAAAAIDRQIFDLGDGEFMPAEDVLAWLDLLARFHLVECLIQHANDARTRYFSTTGLPFLDDNGPGVRTTKGSLVNKMLKQMDVLARALELYGTRKFIPLTSRRARLVKDSVPLDEAIALEQGMTKYLGDSTGAAVHQSLKRVGKQIRRFKGALKRMKGDKTFLSQDAWQGRGPHPLQMLWLNASFAAGWLQQPRRHHIAFVEGQEFEDIAGELIGKAEADAQTRMHATLWAARKSRPPLAPELRHRHWVWLARQLFFVLRHGITQDPDSKVVAELRLQPELNSLLDVLQRQYDEKERRDARDEAFAYDSAEAAESWYVTAKGGADRISRSLTDEAEGYISIRLRS